MRGLETWLQSSPPLVGLDGMAEEEHREHDREELAGGADRRAHERVEAGDGEVDEVLARRGRQGQAQHVALTRRKGRQGTGVRLDTGVVTLVWDRDREKHAQVEGAGVGERYRRSNRY